MQKIILFLLMYVFSLPMQSQKQSSPVRYDSSVKKTKCSSIRGKFYLFGLSDQKINSTQYDYIDFSRDIHDTFRTNRGFRTVLNNENVYIDSLGNVIVKDIYNDLIDLSYLGIDAVIVEKGNKYGVVSADFKRQILPFEYEYISLLDKKYFSLSQAKTVGVADLDRHIIIPPYIYTGIRSNLCINNLFLMIKDEQKYLINNEGKTVATFGDYNIQIQKVSDKLNWIKYDSEEGLIDSSGKWIYPLGEYSISIWGSLGSIKDKNRKFGLINSKAELILPVEYDDIDLRAKGNGAFLKRKQPSTQASNTESDSDEFVYQYVDSLGNIKINSSKKIIEYDKELYAYIPTRGYATYDINGNPKASYPGASLPAYLWEIFYDKKTEKVGVKDRWDNIKIPAQFDELPSMHFGRSTYTRIAKFGDFYKDCNIGKCKYGVIDTLGNIVIPPIYDGVEFNSDLNRFIVKKGNEISFLDNKGVGTSHKMKYVNWIYESSADYLFEKNGKYAIFDIYGNQLASFEYDGYELFSDKLEYDMKKPNYPNILLLNRKNKTGIWDIDDRKESIPVLYDDFGLFYSGNLIGYKENNKWGILNCKTNEIIVPAIYDTFRDLDSDLKVRKDSLWGIIDPETGKSIVPIIYEDIIQMKGVLKVRKNSLWGIIDRDGKEILPCRYDLIENPKGDILVVGKDVWCYEGGDKPKVIRSEPTSTSTSTNSDSTKKTLRIVHREGVE